MKTNLKSSGWVKWSKSYHCSDTDEVSSRQRIRKTPKIYQSSSEIFFARFHDKNYTKNHRKKTKAKKLKEKGNVAFQKKNFNEAEKCYSEAIELNIGSRPLWTNRAICRKRMEQFENALLDCETALKIDPKCTKSITQKGNALFGLSRFDEAKKCYELLHTLGESSLANTYLKKLPNSSQE